jgi:hypothetical protein
VTIGLDELVVPRGPVTIAVRIEANAAATRPRILPGSTDELRSAGGATSCDRLSPKSAVFELEDISSESTAGREWRPGPVPVLGADFDNGFALSDGGSGRCLLVQIDALETRGEELTAFDLIAAERAGLGPIERGVGAWDGLEGRSFKAVAAATNADPGFCPALGTAAKRLLRLVGGFGSESLIARADAGRRAISLSSAAIIVCPVCGVTTGASSHTGGKLKGGCSCGSRPVSKWCIVAASA